MAKKTKTPVVDRIPLTRNIGIIAHIDAGKTTTTECMLRYSQRLHRIGRVDEGTAFMDYRPDEQEKGITIVSAATSFQWKTDGTEYDINLIDTPGHVDFTAEVERSLRVLDGAVGVFCANGGVEAQSETVWRQADRYNVPRIAYVNKMDRSGAEYFEVLKQMEEILGARPVAIQIPIGAERDFAGCIDLVAMKQMVWSGDGDGSEFETGAIADDLADEAALYREQLVDALSEDDEEFMEKALAEELEEADFHAALRRACLSGRLTPVLCGASLRLKGVQPLLDAVMRYLPSPLDRPPVIGKAPKRRKKSTFDEKNLEDWTDVERGCDPAGPLAALVFKTQSDKHADLNYMRIYSGELKEGQMLFNITQNRKERVSKLFKMHAAQKEQIKQAVAGDIVGCVGFRFTRTGDTLCETSSPIMLENIRFPETVMSRAVEPKSSADRDKLIEILEAIERDDPTFRSAEDPQTGQLILSGMGELHLEIIKNQIEREKGVQARFRDLRVAYKQALAGEGTARSKPPQSQSGRNLVAEVELTIRRDASLEPGAPVVIANFLDSEEVPKNFWPAIEEGVKGAAIGGYAWGYPLIQTRVSITGGSYDPVESNEEAFAAAASMAFDKAVKAAGVDLLEPLMAFDIVAPDEKVGDVVNDLNRRGASVKTMEVIRGGKQQLRGSVPLASMIGYADEFRSLTSGRGSFSMEPLEYDAVPESRRPELF